MTYRGRLIRPMLVRIARYDTAATQAVDPDGAGSLVDGYDPDFREPRRVDDGSQVGVSTRVDCDPIDLPAQIEDDQWETLRMAAAGDDPATGLSLVFHFADLERLGYIDPTTGDALVPRKSDRLVAIVDPVTREVMQAMPGDGLFCTMAQPRSYGLAGRKRNLLLARFEERAKAPEG